MSSHRVVATLAALAMGCAGSYGGKPRHAKTAAAKTPLGSIETAALAYSIVDARTGRQVDTAVFWTQLGQARAVCVGEDHSEVHHHWAQLEITRQLAQRKA